MRALGGGRKRGCHRWAAAAEAGRRDCPVLVVYAYPCPHGKASGAQCSREAAEINNAELRSLELTKPEGRGVGVVVHKTHGRRE